MTATSTRSSSTTGGARARQREQRAWQTRSWSPASKPGARSRASTAWGWTRPAPCRSSSIRTTWRRWLDCGERSIQGRSPTPAKSSPPRGCAEKRLAPTAATPWRRSDLPSVFEVRSVREAAEILRRAAAERLTVSIDRPGGDLVVSTRGLDQVLEHEAGDLTCTVEAGIRLSSLNGRLAGHGQMLALDPPGDPTIGACIAANLSGPRRHRYGTMRDLLLGVTVVLGDGLVASAGGKVVKNVAGYDLGKLLVGSQGRLGLVARASLRLHPLPGATATLVVPVDSPEEAHHKAQAILRSTLVPSALDILWPGRLAVMFEGSPKAVAAQIDRAAELVGGEEAGDAVWEEARARQARAPGCLSFSPGGLAQVLGSWEEAVVRVSAGLAYVPEPVPEEVGEPLRSLVERLRAAFDPAGVLV
ncbi:MAG: hypothetical protein C4306_07060 [Thermoleophilia bacterium]